MADSKKTTLIADVQTTLEGITVANGYTYDVQTVQIGATNLIDEKNLPALFIIVYKSPAAWLTNVEYRRDLFIRIIAKISVNSDPGGTGLLTNALNNLEADVFKAMMVDINRGNSSWCMFTRYLGHQDPLYDWGENTGYIPCEFQIRYRHGTDSP